MKHRVAVSRRLLDVRFIGAHATAHIPAPARASGKQFIVAILAHAAPPFVATSFKTSAHVDRQGVLTPAAQARTTLAQTPDGAGMPVAILKLMPGRRNSVSYPSASILLRMSCFMSPTI